jgi:hypothetical protein
MKRSQIDEAVVWQLMRFPDESEEPGRRPSLGPREPSAAVVIAGFRMGAAGFEPATSRV